ncbi:MAG TPA: lamin tail domain-containing protein, partial [Bacteroidales bacterium]|nr:lamin tail domain-containing protein [Bacteroidales bacterium]
MKKFFPVLLFIAMTAKAQIAYDFENGGIENWFESSTNTWGICNTAAISGLGSLCHVYDNPSSGHDQISLPLYPLSVTDSTTLWRFEIRHAYDPSSYNNWGYFLFADQPASQMYPGTNINGYAVGVNITGSDDLLKIWKFVNGEPEILLATEINWQEQIGTSNAAGIEVSRNSSGLWMLSVDKDGGFDQLEQAGTIVDNNFTKALYTGLYFKYSSANDRKLSLDNLLIKGYFPRDTVIPEILKILVQDSKHLKILFSEPVVSADAEKTQNYQINGTTPARPDSVNLLDDHTVILILQSALPDGSACFLEIQNISDLAGNRINKDPISFVFHKPGSGDIVINEIMADPSPQQGLPECEYLELVNTAEYEINLTNWILSTGENSSVFPECILEAGEYLLITNSDALETMKVYGKTLPLFSSVYTLSNDGIILRLSNADSTEISNAVFNPAWHTPRGKAAGG